jgi:hypothetical protein
LQATLAGITLTPPLLGLHPLAVKACCSAEATPLPADRTLLLKDIEAFVNALEARLGDEVTGLPTPVPSTGRPHLRRRRVRLSPTLNEVKLSADAPMEALPSQQNGAPRVVNVHQAKTTSRASSTTPMPARRSSSPTPANPGRG